jgi:hypothetical protein
VTGAGYRTCELADTVDSFVGRALEPSHRGSSIRVDPLDGAGETARGAMKRQE